MLKGFVFGVCIAYSMSVMVKVFHVTPEQSLLVGFVIFTTFLLGED